MKLVVDPAGDVALGALDVEAPIEALASGMCKTLGALLGTDLGPVAVRSVPGDNVRVGLVMLCERSTAGVRFRSGTATGGSAPEAVALAILDAAVPARGLLGAAMDRWSATDDVSAVTLLDGARVVAATGDKEETERHRRLLASMPGSGRLAAATEAGEYRVLLLASGALVLTARPDSTVLDEVDQWMALLEEPDLA